MAQKLNGPHKLLACADDVHLLGDIQLGEIQNV
jgi:hypothetical protein